MPIGAALIYDVGDVGLIPMNLARSHLRVAADYPTDQIAPYLYAAEQSAVHFINRRVFVDQTALAAAIAAVPSSLDAAEVSYTAALVVADALSGDVAREQARQNASDVFSTVQTSARAVYAGVALDDEEVAYPFVAGVLLILGHLFENRETVVIGSAASQLPMGAHGVLMPLRTGLGV